MAANILVFGDSISLGLYDSEGGWVDRLKRYCLNDDRTKKRTLNRYVYNLSISGETSKEIVKRIDCESFPRNWADRPTIFLLAFGINDPIIIDGKKKTSEQKFKGNILKMIKKCKKYSEKIVFIGPTQVDEPKVSPMPWSPTEIWQNSRIKKYSNLIKRTCKEENAEFLELIDLFNSNNYSKYLADGAHPNTKGHKLIFETVKDYLEKKKYI